MRHPCEFFIKYLMTQDRIEARSIDWVAYNVVCLGFPPADLTYIKHLQQQLDSRLPKVFRPQDRYHRESVKFLRAEGIWTIHNPDQAMREATLLLTNIKPRKVIEQLLLSRMEPREAARKTNSRFSCHLTTAGVESYKHYYWNVDICTLNDWDKLLESYDYTTKAKALSVIQVGPAMALHQAGFAQNIESRVMLRDMLQGVYFDFKDWQAQPLSVNKSKCLVGLSKSAAMLSNQMSQADSALKDSLKQFEQFRMHHADSQVPGIRDIAPSGNFSLSGAKLLDSPKKDKSDDDAPTDS